MADTDKNIAEMACRSVAQLKDIEIWDRTVEHDRAVLNYASVNLDHSIWRRKLASAVSQGMLSSDVTIAIIRGDFQDVAGACALRHSCPVVNGPSDHPSGGIMCCGRASTCDQRKRPIL